MRSIGSNIITELESEELRPFYLLDMDIDSTNYRYTDCDIPINLTNMFYPRGFRSDGAFYSMANIVDKTRIEIDNLDNVLTSVFVGGTPQGSDVSLSLVVLDSSYDIVDSTSVTIFQGEIDSWELAEDKVNIEVASIFSKWSQKTLSKHGASCRWKVFTGSECGYSGAETWCDRTYARCTELSNTANFGGFRWLPSIVDKEIWWGRVQK